MRSAGAGGSVASSGMRWRRGRAQATPTAGPQPATVVVVPRLVGLDLRAAQDAALDAGLLGVVAGDGDARGAGQWVRTAARAGEVVDQSPPPGAETTRGAQVQLWRRPPHDPGTDPESDGGGGGGGGGGLRPGPRPVLPAGTK